MMRIQCDVCEKEEATTFCSADEAALCDSCDSRVHCANKLAGMHPRYSLLHPTFKDLPLCDICLERRGLLFCQEDRAILCRECDLPIHRPNQHTQKHNRFLLTGVKLSSSASHRHGSSVPSSSSSDLDPYETRSSPSKSQGQAPSFNPWCSDAGSVSTSSISEYLMEGLPGWNVDDLLEPSAAPDRANYDLGSETSSTASREFGYWVGKQHQVPYSHNSSSVKKLIVSESIIDPEIETCREDAVHS